METPNLGGWSELLFDLLEAIFKRLSRADFHRAKLVCRNWNSSSKLTVPRQSTTPWLILFADGYEYNGCMLYNPEEDRVYNTTNRYFSGSQLLSSSGNWFLVKDSHSYLYIIDVFSDEEIDLPSLESIKSRTYNLKRVGRNAFRREFRTAGSVAHDLSGDDLKGLVWVDEKTEEYVVVWFFDGKYLGFCKNGDDYYTNITLSLGVTSLVQGCIYDMVLRGYRLYVLTTHHYLGILDLSGEQGFEDVTVGSSFPMFALSDYMHIDCSLTVTTSGEDEVLVVENVTIGRQYFIIYKKDPNVEVDSLGSEAILSDLGITAVHGVEPNSIYFTHYDRTSHWEYFDLNVDIGVYNLATKTFKTSFPSLSKMNLEDARWFLPNT